MSVRKIFLFLIFELKFSLIFKIENKSATHLAYSWNLSVNIVNVRFVRIFKMCKVVVGVR